MVVMQSYSGMTRNGLIKLVMYDLKEAMQSWSGKLIPSPHLNLNFDAGSKTTFGYATRDNGSADLNPGVIHGDKVKSTLRVTASASIEDDLQIV